MLTTINFDYYHRIERDEINDVLSEWMLSAKSSADALPCAQFLPNGEFSVGGV
jgi:hypothetical protein